MAVCSHCGREYRGSYHRDCPGPSGGAASARPASGDPLVRFFPPELPPATAPTTAPGAESPSAAPQGRSPFESKPPAPAQAERQPRPPSTWAEAPAPRVRQQADEQRPAQPLAPAPAPRPRAVAGRRCRVIARSQGSARRPLNNAMIAALLGLGLIIWAAGGICLFVLLVAAVAAARRWLWALLFPGDRVSVWYYEVYDLERQGSYGVAIFDPDGVPPGEQSIVRVRGRRVQNAFRASHILREQDASGVPVLGRDGLVARVFPPMWLGGALFGLGFLLFALRWLALL